MNDLAEPTFSTKLTGRERSRTRAECMAYVRCQRALTDPSDAWLCDAMWPERVEIPLDTDTPKGGAA